MAWRPFVAVLGARAPRAAKLGGSLNLREGPQRWGKGIALCLWEACRIFQNFRCVGGVLARSLAAEVGSNSCTTHILSFRDKIQWNSFIFLSGCLLKHAQSPSPLVPELARNVKLLKCVPSWSVTNKLSKFQLQLLLMPLCCQGTLRKIQVCLRLAGHFAPLSMSFAFRKGGGKPSQKSLCQIVAPDLSGVKVVQWLSLT